MSQDTPAPADQQPTDETTPASALPEAFPQHLLQRPAQERLAYFEQQVIIEHNHLLKALKQTIQLICAAEDPGSGSGPGPGLLERTERVSPVSASDLVLPGVGMPLVQPDRLHVEIFRRACMVLVIGPSRVGKTLLVRLLCEDLHQRVSAVMAADPGCIPFISFSIAGARAGRFDWVSYYEAVLRELGDPFVASAHTNPRIRRVRDYQAAMEEATVQRKTRVIVLDEAHDIAKAAS